jgi:hypothetical protein
MSRGYDGKTSPLQASVSDRATNATKANDARFTALTYTTLRLPRESNVRRVRLPYALPLLVFVKDPTWRTGPKLGDYV